MNRALERLDGAASTIVPLAYLAGLMLGTMSYFAGVTLNAGLAVGLALALAAELHSFLEQRRVRALWAAFQRASDLDTRDRLSSQLRAHVVILAVLVAFSAVNATAFAAERWRPAHGFLPDWLQIGIRGAVVPCLFLLTGALSPLTISAGDELAGASRSMLRKTIRATVKQWNQRIERARRGGVDLAPVAVSLMLDAGDHEGARRVQLIADGLDAAERGEKGRPPYQPIAATALESHPVAPFTGAGMPDTPPAPNAARAILGSPEPAVSATETPPDKPPTGPGSPARRSRASKRRIGLGNRPRIVHLDAPEQRVRAALAESPRLSIRQLAKRAKVSQATASKYARIVAAERRQVAQ